VITVIICRNYSIWLVVVHAHNTYKEKLQSKAESTRYLATPQSTPTIFVHSLLACNSPISRRALPCLNNIYATWQTFELRKKVSD